MTLSEKINGLNDESKWIRFLVWPSDMLGKKTLVFLVLTKDELPLTLGKIKWFGRWRQYAFFPEAETVFEKKCLADITNFLKLLMDERKNNGQREQIPTSENRLQL